MADPLSLLAYAKEKAGTVISPRLPISHGTCGSAFCSSSTHAGPLVASCHYGWWFGCLGAYVRACLLVSLLCLLLICLLLAGPMGR